jgi:predicted nucleic acid-binding protein
LENALADTGLWYAIFDRRDQYHSEAQEKAEALEPFQIVLPWPTLYETLRTKFVRNRTALGQFERYLKNLMSHTWMTRLFERPPLRWRWSRRSGKIVR